MNKFILTLALILVAGVAYAGYDVTAKNILTIDTMPSTETTENDYIFVRRIQNTLNGEGVSEKLSMENFFYNGNPLVQNAYSALTAAEISATDVLIPADSGKTIQVLGFGVEASGGNLTGATAVTIECTGGDDISSIGAAAFTSGVFVGPEVSAPSGTAPANVFNMLPCPAGEGVQVKAPAAATATHVRVSLQYTWE